MKSSHWGISFEEIVKIKICHWKSDLKLEILDNTTTITSYIQKYLEVSNVSFRLEIFNWNGIIFCWKQLPVKIQIDRYFVSLVQGTINLSSNVKKIRMTCFLFFTHLILKLLFLTLWYRLFGKDSYDLVRWTVKLKIYVVFTQNYF